MARLQYDHLYSAAGFSGETWDITVGHNLSFTSAALATTFSTGPDYITLSAGVFPAWFVVGKVFTTNNGPNPGPFRVKAVISTTVIEVWETLTPAAAVTVIFSGSADTAIQDVLLSAGAGILTEDAPHVLESTGALGAARTLSIAAMEVESASRGSQNLQGRFFYISIRNSDILTNSITFSSSGTINGAATFVVSTLGDYLFHYSKGGAWRANVLPSPSENIATLKRVPFIAANWDAGVVKNTIKILQVGSPGLGEVGPHTLTTYGSYIVQVINTDLTPDETVDVEIQFASNGDITMKKSGLGQDFNGVALIAGTLD